MVLVKSIKHLKKLASNKNGDFIDFVVFLSKFAKSSKRIIYYGETDEFSIINEIDDSYQELTTDELASKTILVTAIQNRCLFLE